MTVEETIRYLDYKEEIKRRGLKYVFRKIHYFWTARKLEMNEK